MQKKVGTAIVVLLALGALGVLASEFLSGGGTAESVHRTLYPDATTDWRDLIKRKGPAAAYEIFKIENLQADREHLGAHQFGRALYLEVGMEAISICDPLFGYGCYHELVTQAIYDNGMQVVQELDEACKRFVDRHLACQHGIGHAVLSLLGYTEDALLESLAICRGLKYADPIGGCVWGVFMEFTLRTMLSLEQNDKETSFVVHEDPMYPCTIAGMYPYRAACYHWQPLLWVKNVPRSERLEGTALITMLDERCSLIPEDDRHYCVRGVGNVVSLWAAEWDPHVTVNLCEMLKGAHDRDICLYTAASVFAGNVMYEKRAEVICEAIVGEAEKTRCEQEFVL